MAIADATAAASAIRHLTMADPILYLSPSPDLSSSARAASQHLFSSLKPHTPKSPFDHLLIDGFDAEQIWQQIDLQSQPLIASLRREVRQLEKNPEEIGRLFRDVAKVGEDGVAKARDDDVAQEIESFDDDDDVVDGDEEEEGESEEEEDGGGQGGVEDKFFKKKELEEYLEDDEAREYGLGKNKEKKKEEKAGDEEGDKEDEEGDEDDELELLGADMDDEEGEDDLANARYEDFFGSKKKNDQKREPKQDDESEDSDMYGEEDDKNTAEKREPEQDDESEDSDMYGEEDDENTADKQKQNLSTHEKEQQKLRAKIEEMEQANLDPKNWFMQGEVTAAKRPKNSALEVDLDFEHNVRPPPVITEDFTADIEELIKKRILEGKFDEVQRVPGLQAKSPKEYKEMDENKSKKGLAEIYEDEYVQKTGLVSAALSFSDEQKKEASMLFKKLCMKLDALSHFHFTPKPVIDDMSVQANVPALAMEEIAPLAVSDAAMLAPEEVYAGKGDIKDETELTQAERKRRRANKKRKFKAESVKRTAIKKARESMKQNQPEGKEES